MSPTPPGNGVFLGAPATRAESYGRASAAPTTKPHEALIATISKGPANRPT